MLGIFATIAPAASQPGNIQNTNAILQCGHRISRLSQWYTKPLHYGRGLHSFHEIAHYSEVLRLADQAQLLVKPDLATHRMAQLLSLHGIEKRGDMSKKLMIKDAATHAGVSKPTMSLVIQNRLLVKEDTRKLVRGSMQTLNYVRNRAAATLLGSGTDLVGLVINELRNPFFTEFAASAQRTFSDHGFATLIANCDETPQIQQQVVHSMLEHDVTALLISPCNGNTQATFDAIAHTAIPTLQVLRQADHRQEIFPPFN